MKVEFLEEAENELREAIMHFKRKPDYWKNRI